MIIFLLLLIIFILVVIKIWNEKIPEHMLPKSYPLYENHKTGVQDE